MIVRPTTNQFKAEAQAKELSRMCGVAYLNRQGNRYRATVGSDGEISIAKFENGVEVPAYRRTYFENAVLCGECTGAGCKRCYTRKGVESFWEYNYNHRGEDPIMIGVTYTACVKELNNPNR